jgi:predicted SAM-dependent methyltransferase
MEQKKYIQFGSGNIYVSGWENYDSSPTLIIQQIPLLGKILEKRLNVIFDKGIIYGDIVKGLPLEENSVDGIFSSHTLEHLSYCDFKTALINCYKYLRPGGRMRTIMPNLDYYVQKYIENKSINDLASVDFMKSSFLGRYESRKTLKLRLVEMFSNSRHQWLWDKNSFKEELNSHGFCRINDFKFGSCDDSNFLKPEREYQFANDAILVECFKP